MTVPDAIIDRMAGVVAGIDTENKPERSAAWKAEGIKICIEQIQEIREIEGVAGVHIMGHRVGRSRAPHRRGGRSAAASDHRDIIR